MERVGIVGISGYSGLTSLELLLKHSKVKLTYVSANNTEGKVGEIWPQLKGITPLTCEKFSITKAAESCDIILLAVPHGAAMTIVPQLLAAKKKVIDFSGDYRLKSTDDYKNWYGADHSDPSNMKKAVYGLPEFNREEIKKATLVSNPGCYPTAALLALAPAVTNQGGNIRSIIIDAKSGTSGAGRKATLAFSFSEVNENFKAYKVLNHQHTPEIDRYLSKFAGQEIAVNFVPHLLPITRGILETIYVQFDSSISEEDLFTAYKRFYKTEPFVRVLEKGHQPELRFVNKTNFCDIGLTLDKNKKLLVITSAIDNLMKGAAGQAIQNLNLMCGIDEHEALI